MLFILDRHNGAYGIQVQRANVRDNIIYLKAYYNGEALNFNKVTFDSNFVFIYNHAYDRNTIQGEENIITNNTFYTLGNMREYLIILEILHLKIIFVTEATLV